MTPDQEAKFQLYGCGSRCLIKLAEIQGNPITMLDFIDRFAPKFWTQDARCGITSTSHIVDIARELGLCTTIETSGDKEWVKRVIDENQTRGILVRTDRTRDRHGKFVENHHCRLYLDRNMHIGRLWHPNPDGQEFEMDLLECELCEQLPHFIVLA